MLAAIKDGKHVFTQWTPLLERRIMHHPEMNPFNFARNQGLRMRYAAEVCPRTLELLRRAYFFPLNPDWTAEQVAERIRIFRAAGSRIQQPE